jgi:hypothetical protein
VHEDPDGVIVATVMGAIVQLPPGTGSLTIMDDPTQTWLGPRIAAGDELTVSTLEAAQPPAPV